MRLPTPLHDLASRFLGNKTLILFLLIVAVSYFLARLWVAWSGGWCRHLHRMDGQLVVITGGNRGIGYCTAGAVAKRGGTVIIGCRDTKLGASALNRIIQKTGNKNVFMYPLDLASIASIDLFVKDVDEFLTVHPNLHFYGLICNAGVMFHPWGKTKDGFEMTVGINYIGHFRLVMGLLTLIKAHGTRVITLSSVAHRSANRALLPGLVYKDQKSYNRFLSYGDSKLFCLMFAHELNRRLMSAGSQARAFSVHPGVVDTDLYRELPTFVKPLMWPFVKAFEKTAVQGAQTTLEVLFNEEFKEHHSGEYFADCRPRHPGHPLAFDPQAEGALWAQTEGLLADAAPKQACGPE